MSLIEPTILIDLISIFWITIVTLVTLVWLPLRGTKISTIENDNISLKANHIEQLLILGLWLQNIFFIVVGALGLSYFNLLNWLTLILLYVSCITLNYLKSYSWRIGFFREIIQSKIINLIDFLDSGISSSEIIKKIKTNTKITINKTSDRFTYLIDNQGIFFLIILIVILGFTFLLRWEYPFLELRFSHPNNYHALLITRQLLSRDYPSLNHLPIFPVLAAIISLLGSIEPMQVIRFLSPIMGIVLVISMGYLVRVLTKNTYGSLIPMFTLGVYLFTWKIDGLDIDWINRIIDSLNTSLIRQWTGSELELGTIFLLLGMTYCFSNDISKKTISFPVNLVCSIVLVGISAPPLLIIFTIALLVAIANRKLVLTAIVFTWIMLAVFAAMSQGEILWLQSFLLTLPIALSLLAGLIFNVISYIVKILSPKFGEIFCLGVVFALSINFLLPLTPNIIYVEYDMAARKSLEIKKLFPAQTWTLVAPVEQLTQIYGEGWYQDLALFVEQYAEQVSKPDFDFPISGEDLFIMVEKIPFVTFPNEADTIPYSLLSDRTYQYYRSSAGRASLEYEALKMCRTYSRNHPHNSSVYYEDRELKIYHFTHNS